ncbi:MAG TPA: hypothetical protein VF611_08255 [Pyrinomonadaceae bacterium]|jgi:hypothetical protein
MSEQSEDLKELTERGRLTLRTRGGEVAAHVSGTPALALMAANGHPAEGLLWGARFFRLTPEGRYVEGFLYPLPTPGSLAFPYASAGAALTAWLGERLRRHPQLTLMLGTRLARVIALHLDGRLECEVETEALEPERQFVALEPRHLEQIVRQLPALARGSDAEL